MAGRRYFMNARQRKATQWMKSWDLALNSDGKENKSPFPKEFYVASVPLKTLRALAGVNKRDLDDRRKNNKATGYQREHQSERSVEIARYISYGYPLSKQKNLDIKSNANLVHPGWLPTAILANIVPLESVRRYKGKDVKVERGLDVQVKVDNGQYILEYPDLEDFDSKKWEDIQKPIEIIDGQHRVFAVPENEEELSNYEVPVVFFDGLSLEYQAYLFWVINVEPKRINPSLAFDIYPALRRQDWLERGEGLKVYQEHRSQELTEILWRHQESPWKDRIELHGARIDGHVSNAAFIRSLMVSFVRRWNKSSDRIGGLFGSVQSDNSSEPERVLPWKRTQQAAFLIFIWKTIEKSVERSQAKWAIACRCLEKTPQPNLFGEETKKQDEAFAGCYSLLATDQGVRALLRIFNAFIYVCYEELELETWQKTFSDDSIDDAAVTYCLNELQTKENLKEYLQDICSVLFHSDNFDWRISSFPGLSLDERTTQASFRGSSGYTLLYTRCLNLLSNCSKENIRAAAEDVKNRRS